MYQKPLTIEAKMDMALSASSGLVLKAWELRLSRGNTNDPESFTVPDGLGPGYVALVWKGAARLKHRDDNEFAPKSEGAFSIFSLENVAEIAVAESANEVQLAVIAVVSPQGSDPDLGLEPIGQCENEPLPMPDTSDGSPTLTLVIRRLDFASNETAPPFPDWEIWPRPGFFLTTTGGPQTSSPCAEKQSGRASPDLNQGGLVLVALPAGAEVTFSHGGDKALSTAYVLDFYSPNDDVRGRDIVVIAPGCYIRCWGP